MTIEQAIEKAVEGGYHRGQIGTSPIVEINCDFAITETKGERNHYGLAWVWLDPLFWQSLGKAMGWPEDTTYCDHCGEADIADEYITHDEEHSDCSNILTFPKYWRYQWHRFIDHLAEGKDAESFFESL